MTISKKSGFLVFFPGFGFGFGSGFAFHLGFSFGLFLLLGLDFLRDGVDFGQFLAQDFVIRPVLHLALLGAIAHLTTGLAVEELLHRNLSLRNREALMKS